MDPSRAHNRKGWKSIEFQTQQLDVITHTYDIYASPSYRIPLSSSKHNSKASTISPSFRFSGGSAVEESKFMRPARLIRDAR